MKKPILLAFLFCSLSAFGQSVHFSSDFIIKNVSEHNAAEPRLSSAYKLTLSPNPVYNEEPIISIIASGLEVFSYIVYNSQAEIVEIENLSGRPDGTTIALPQSVDPGFYYVRFETSQGIIIRKLSVL
jgi:hypothetical protein